jgi:hypothetical protein
MGTEIMLSQGDQAAAGVSALGSYRVEGGPPCGWRTTIERPDSDRLAITMYIITPDGDEAKGVETVYHRSRAG